MAKWYEYAANPVWALSKDAAEKGAEELGDHMGWSGDKGGAPAADANQSNITQGMQEGRTRAQEVYGQDNATTGSNIQDIISKRRAAMTGEDPASSAMREGRNREMAMAQARGANEGQVAQVARDAESRIDRQRFERQDKTLTDYQKLIGNVLGGSTSLEMGFGGLRGAGTANPPPVSSSNALGSVICTQLYYRGLLDQKTYSKDTAYGIRLRETDPAVYAGYIAWAPTVVKWMRKSRLVHAIVAVPALAWARNMAGEKNTLGRLVALIGEPICRFIGRKHVRQVQSTETENQEREGGGLPAARYAFSGPRGSRRFRH